MENFKTWFEAQETQNPKEFTASFAELGKRYNYDTLTGFQDGEQVLRGIALPLKTEGYKLDEKKEAYTYAYRSG